MNNTERSDYEKRIKKNRVFILGAGFSADAKIPLTAELLQKTMKKFSIECPGLFERINGYALECLGGFEHEVDYSTISFSNLCTFLEYIELREYGGGERWSSAGSREKLALRFYLAKTIVEHTPSSTNLPKVYIDFASQLHENDIVISFNWDGLLEIALQRLNKSYTYNANGNKSIKLSKFHGSVNWRLNKPKKFGTEVNTLDWKPLNFAGGLLDTEIYFTPDLLQYRTWSYHQPLGEVEPFLVLPGYGKAFDVRSNAWLWYKPENVFSYTHDIFIIGLGLAPDDFFIRSFFLSNLPYIDGYSGVDGRKIYIINPDPNCQQNYDFVLSNGYAEHIDEKFSSKHVEFMKSKLNGK